MKKTWHWSAGGPRSGKTRMVTKPLNGLVTVGALHRRIVVDRLAMKAVLALVLSGTRNGVVAGSTRQTWPSMERKKA